MLSATFHLPTFTPNNILLHFGPDPSLPLEQTGLPDPGRGGKIEAKLVIGEGAGHGVWKRIEGERSRWAEKRKEENVLRELSRVHGVMQAAADGKRRTLRVRKTARQGYYSGINASRRWRRVVNTLYLTPRHGGSSFPFMDVVHLQTWQIRRSCCPPWIPPNSLFLLDHSHELRHQLIPLFRITLSIQPLQERYRLLRLPPRSCQEQIRKSCRWVQGQQMEWEVRDQRCRAA
jgi:hypothetical protein